jgi:hypothetical protein
VEDPFCSSILVRVDQSGGFAESCKAMEKFLLGAMRVMVMATGRSLAVSVLLLFSCSVLQVPWAQADPSSKLQF